MGRNPQNGGELIAAHPGGAGAAGTLQEIIDSASAMRHELHRSPELAWHEHGTAARIRSELDALGIAWRACATTGTVAALAPDAPGRHVALRGDIDAMPVTEDSGAPWSSQSPGAMHACGHDGHTAVLLATAKWLAAHEATLPGPVTLLFQPAEEGGHGAPRMIEDGALEGVDVIFGWHNWPALGRGRLACPDGPVMSANGAFAIDVTGIGGHGSQPEVTRDPVLAAAAITVALQQLVARRMAPQTAAVVAVTWIDAPGNDTVTPASARLGGSIRVPNTSVRDELFSLIAEVAGATARAYGVEAETTTTPRYGATVNHPDQAAELRAALEPALEGAFGAIDHSPDIPIPVMASEDFSYYLDEIPGAFALVGAGDPHSCHSPHYDFNDALIEPVLRAYAQLAGAPDLPAGDPAGPARRDE
ncbi:N(2)-acetyl-L-2,4-diaminobutanoate deacetylase DoeB2 [Microbacterium halophytorum]|uniref:N(2)-acetyl-L-2,4-diaminobutanoate deacetylase DoeB2 n=1 Tax=Microbacterium halophytorum TaxID=2067568 RepID=UPI000CFDB44F|nr:N(2)-acetyl-L-2,4-diaminobutanoate deacetylase DoeB2 [Microbacterium halophytorum]